MDELVYHPDINSIFQYMKDNGYTIGVPYFYHMIGSSIPAIDKQITEQIQYGVLNHRHKAVIVDPKAIKTMNFTLGSHDHSPIGTVKEYRNDELKTLHYKHLSDEYYIEREAMLNERRGEEDLANGWSFHHGFPKEKMIEIINRRKQLAVKVV